MAMRSTFEDDHIQHKVDEDIHHHFKHEEDGLSQDRFQDHFRNGQDRFQGLLLHK